MHTGCTDQTDYLSIVNPDRKLLPGPQLLHELISSDAEDQVAIDFVHLDGVRTEISYASFHQLSHCLAQQIRAALPQQLRTGQIIPVIIPQCPELYVAWRAVLIAGAAFCPVSPETPIERLKFILGDVSANLVLCLPEGIPRIHGANPDMPCVPVSLKALRLDVLSAPSQPDPSVLINTQDPAYVQYTSGSSGLPKGVLVSHFSVTQSLLAHDEHVPPFKRFLQFASPTFDVSIFEIFFPFFRGSTLVGCPRDRMLADLPGAITSLRADAAELTPTVAGTLLKSRAAAPGLKTLLTIGEMLTGPVVTEFGGSNERESMLYAMYGPTEAAIHCTVAAKLAADATVRSIGSPLSTVTAFVLVENSSRPGFSITPRGESGELAVAGQLADGYLNRPDKNADAFIELPGYGHVYRTGDRAICRPDGRLEILGRISEGQVKLRGQRIELGEIDEVACKTPGCSLAIASVIDDSLVLFCVADQDLSSKRVLDTCRAWLPTYMRPAHIVMLPDDVPRLPSGKVDRRQLKTLYQERRIQTSSQPEFKNETERQIAEAFQAVLRTTIHSTTNLWSVGLDSLRAIKISASLRKNFPNCTLAMLLEAETIADISDSLEQIGQSAAAPFSANFETVDDIAKWSALESTVRKSLRAEQIPSPTKVLPCSSMQVAMLTETASLSHLNFNTIKVKRALEVSHSNLCQALRSLAKSNEILRSGFYYAGDDQVPFVQLVWDSLVFNTNSSLLHPLQIQIDDDDPDVSVILIHHAMYDGWSWELILDDLNTILGGQDPPVRPTYLQFVQFQTRRQRAQPQNEDLDYWSSLGLDSGSQSMPSLSASSSKSKRIQLIHDLDVSYVELSTLAENVRVSRQAILQTCWAQLLATYTDSTEVIFGDVVSGRHVPLEDIDQIIGPCLSTHPVKVELKSHKTFRDLVVSSQRQYLERLKHTDTPLHDVLRQIPRLKDQRIFDSLFVWQQGEVRPPQMRKYLSTLSSTDALNYPAVIEVEPLENIVQARLTVEASHIPPAQAKLLLAHFNYLLSFVTSHLDSIRLDNSVWQALDVDALSASNVHPKVFDHSFDLCTTIETLAKQDPQRPALRFVKDFDPTSGYLETNTVTYFDLFRKATAFASLLVQRWNPKANDLICIISQKSVDLYISILAVVLTDAGYMYIDPSTPENRIQQILDQAHCNVIISDGSVQIDNGSPTVLLQDLAETASDVENFQRSTSTGDNLAYCVWTSGTTGKPKGVLVPRQSLLSNLDFLSSAYPCEPEQDALLQSCSPAFDVSVFEIFWTWHMGMTLCAARNDVLFRDIEKLIDALDVTFLSMTPSVAALVNPENTPKVKTLVAAGEPMTSRVFERWAGRGLFNGYGPSETTNICSLTSQLQPNDDFHNVGHACSSISLFICQRAPKQQKESPLSPQDFHLLPRGAVGEVWIGGHQLARGYLDHQATMHKFLDHPQFGRLYRSGDVGRLLADETLVLLGRDDDQVKVRGQRIELDEINKALIRSIHVENATSLLHHSNGRDNLLAFCQLKNSAANLKTTVSGLLHSLENTLPTYMVPDFVIPVRNILLTHQGKVDKGSLLQQYQDLDAEDLHAFSRQHQSSLDEEYDASDATELAIAEALEATLNVPQSQIKQGTSFYALGLDSINCIRLSQRLTQSFGQVDVSTIMKHPSIKLLKPLLLSKTGNKIASRKSKSSDQYFDLEAKERIQGELLSLDLKIQSILPCTDLQLSMLSATNDASAAAYHNTLVFSIKGDSAKLKAAWELVQSRHGLLRTVFVKTLSSQMPYAQVVLADVKLPWHNIQGPGDRGFLPYSLTEEQQKGSSVKLKLEIHHALYDAEAISLLLGEVQAIYRGSELGPLASFHSYLDYMINLDDQTTDQTWSNILRGSDSSRLTEVLPEVQSGTDSGVAAHLSSRCSLASLEAAGRKQCVTTLTILEATLARLLMAYLNTNDVCFGNVFSGRNIPVDGIEHIVGPCFNTLPLRGKCRPSNSNSDLVQQLQHLNNDLVSLQPSSPRRIQRLNSSDGGRLFDVLLLLQQDQKPLDSTIWELLDDSGSMSFPFILEILPSRASQSLHLTLHSDVARREVLEQFLDHFDALLHDTINYPSSIACDFSSVSEGIQSLNLRARKSTGRARSKRPLNDSSEALSDMENLVKGILMKFSNVSIDITKETTIFELGLDSINAVQIAAKLRELGYQIPSSAILEAPTLTEIAGFCTSSTSARVKEEQFDIEEFDRIERPSLCTRLSLSSGDIDSVRPCTPTQSGILSEHLKSHGSMYYNTMHLQLAPGVDKENLLRAWQIVMDRHDMLRTGFAATDSPKHPFVMITYKPGVFSLPTGQHKRNNANTETLLEPPWHVSLAATESSSMLRVSLLHALYDAHSLEIFLSDVSHAYKGFDFSLPKSISPVISSIITRGQSQAVKEFWQQDRNLIQPTKFPDLNIKHQKHRTLSVASRLSTCPLSRVQSRSAALGCSLQSVLQYVWARILAAYTSQDRVTFGLTLSGRDFGDDRDEAAFPCINTLPVTIEIGNDRNAVLSQISKLTAGLNKSQHIPLTSIRRWQGIEGDTFDSLLVYQKFTSKQSEDVPWRLLDDEASAEYAVSLEVLPDEERDLIKWQITYSEQVLPPAGANVLVKQLDFILAETLDEGASSTTDIVSANLSILPAKDPFIKTDVRFLHGFVQNSATSQPNAPALEFVTSITPDGKVQKSTWTYRELEHQGNRVANLLIAHGATPGDYVAVCFDKCPEASFAILGALTAGVAYVAIDPGAPTDRKAFVLKDAGCKVVLTTSDKVSNFPSDSEIHVIPLDDESFLLGQSQSPPSLTRPLSPEDTCYCLYTSGSTGTPKGCLISHRSAVQAMLFFQRIFSGHWTASSRWLQFASFHFDVSVLEQYFSWGVGICVTSGPRDLVLEDLPGFIRATKITHLDLTPTLAKLLVPEEVPSISKGVFIVGGEQVTQDIIDTWGDVGCLYNFYGPSEVTIGCTVHPRVKKGVKSTNIGQQWDNVGSFVLEPGSEKPVLRGAIGELCLSGVLVGKGYLNRPDLTKEKFVTLKNYDTEVYRTGDLVRLLNDDSFEFIGRIDDQVKLRGQRLEIGEINQTIREGATEIKAVATLAVKHRSHGREQLVAFISTSIPRRKIGKPAFVLNDEATSLATQLRDFCAQKLPGYMIPSSFIFVSDMPLSANNKIDNKVLRALYESSTENYSNGVDTQEDEIPSEHAQIFDKLCQTLETFLSLPKGTIKPSSRLFELGIDSVSAISFVRKLRMAGFDHVDVATVLRNSMVSQLVLALSSQDNDGTSDTLRQDIDHATARIKAFAAKHEAHVVRLLHLKRDQLESIAPCTPLQEGMISAVTGRNGGEQAYFLQFRLELRSDVDLNKLRTAWREVQKGCSILRTFFVSTPDGFAQVVSKDCDAFVPFEKIESRQGEEESFAEFIQIATDFGHTLPWRVNFSVNSNSRVMTLLIFHGLYDGISLPMLLDKVAAAYNGNIVQRSNFYDVLPHGPLLQRSDAKSFWKQNFKGARSLGMTRKAAVKNGVHPSPLVANKSLRLSNIKNFCTRAEVTEPAVFHAAWLLALHEVYGVNATLGIVLSGRAIAFEGAELVIGPMLNTVPCSIEGLKPAAQFFDLAKACHKYIVDVLPYQHTALRDIAKWTGHDLRKGLFDCLFVFQKQNKALSEQTIWREGPADSTPDYPLNLEVEQKLDGTFLLTIATRQDYMDYFQVEALVGKLQDVLEKFDSDGKLLLPEVFQQNTHADGNDANGIHATLNQTAPLGNIEWTPAAETIREVIAELAETDVHAVGFNAPTIFELGLDSIDAMKLTTRLRAHNLRIPMSELMRAGTVARIAAAVSQISEGSGREAPNGHSEYSNGDVPKGRHIHVLPVTPMQEGLLLDFQKYYNVFVFELNPGTDVQRLRTAWTQLTKVWPILRVKFEVEENLDGSFRYIQVIKDTNDVMEVEEVIGSQNTLSAFVKKMKQVPDELEDMATLRVVIFETGQKQYMLMAMSHACYDGWSLQLLHQELQNLYRNPTADVGTYEGRMRLYRHHLDTIAEQARSVDAEHFWEKSLVNLQPTIVLNTGHDDEASCETQLLQRQSTISLTEVQSFCKTHGVTIQSLGLACWSLLLAHYAQSLRVCFGMILSGRTTEGSDNLALPTFNTVIFTSDIRGSENRAAFVKRTHHSAMDVAEFQHFPLRRALKMVKTGASQSDSFNTLFTYQKSPDFADGPEDIYHEVDIAGHTADAPYAINIEMENKGHRIKWTVATQPGIATGQSAESLLENLDGLLKAVIHHPEGNILSPVIEHVTSICGLPPVTLSSGSKENSEITQRLHSQMELGSQTWTKTEATIRDVLAEVAKVDKQSLSRTAAFYELGLDSVSAIKITGVLKKKGIRLPVSKIVQAQTIERMAKVVEEEQSQPEHHANGTNTSRNSNNLSGDREERVQQYASMVYDTSGHNSLSVANIEDILPATAGQMYMLDIWSRSDGRLLYPTFWFEVGGATESKLREAIKKLQSRTAMLRSTFVVSRAGKVLQVVIKASSADKMHFPWTYTITNKRRYQNSHYLGLKLHHVLYDAVSLNIMIAELTQLCKKFDATPSALNQDLGSFILATTSLDDKTKARQRLFWTSYLGHSSHGSGQLERGSFFSPRVEKYIPNTMDTTSLRKLARAEGVTIQSLFFAACGQAYSELVAPASDSSGKETVVLGLYLANRSINIPDLPSLASPTLNIVPLKIDVAKPLVESARNVQQDIAMISKAENCGVGLGEVYEWTGVTVDCVVNFLRLPNEEEEEEEDKDKRNKREVYIKPVEKTQVDDAGAAAALLDITSPSPLLSASKGQPSTHGHVHTSSEEQESSQDQQNKRMKEWVLPSVDIEAKVEEQDGVLGIGVFSPRDMMDHTGAEGFIAKLVHLLSEL